MTISSFEDDILDYKYCIDCKRCEVHEIRSQAKGKEVLLQMEFCSFFHYERKLCIDMRIGPQCGIDAKLYQEKTPELRGSDYE